MRRLIVTGALLAALAPAAAAGASTPTEPSDQATTGTTEVSAATPPPGDSVATDESVQPTLVYDDSGNPVASIRFRGAESGWSGYPEGEEPDPGNEYVRAMVSVESLVTEGTFGIGAGDFILQNNNGFLTDAESIASANQEETDEDITDEADLVNGESLDLTLTFQVVSSVGPQSIFYQPEGNDEVLVDVAEVSSPDAA